MIEHYEGIPFSDFVKLSNLKPGMVVAFKGIDERLIVGNCTPYNTVSAISNDGWDWSFWKDFLVIQVEYIDGNYITPEYIAICKQNVEAVQPKQDI